MAAVLVAGGLVSAKAAAQTGFFLDPSVSLVGEYDDNVFFSASERRDDFITRVSPAVETGYRSAPLTLAVHYALDAEAYSRHSELDAADARQHAAVEFHSRPTPLLTLEADASRTRTQRPGEFTREVGVEFGRARAERLAAGLGMGYRLGPRTEADATYGVTREDLADRIETETRTATLSLAHEVTRRATTSVEYTGRRFRFEGEDDVTAHGISLGWDYALTPRTSVSLAGGPRYSEGEVDPEGSARISHTLRRGELSAGYTRSLATVIGEPAPVTVDRLSATAVYSLKPGLEIRGAPSFVTSSRGAGRTDLYLLDVEASYRLTRTMSLIASYSITRQRGSLDDPDDDGITRNVVLFGIRMAH